MLPSCRGGTVTAYSCGWGPPVCCITIKAPACLPVYANLSFLPFFPSISLLVFHFILHFTLSSHLSPFSSNHPSRKYHAKPLLYCLAFYMRQNMLRQGHSQATSAFACLQQSFLGNVGDHCWWDRTETKFLVPATTRKTDSLRWKVAFRRLVDVRSSAVWEAFSQEKELSPWLKGGATDSDTYF